MRALALLLLAALLAGCSGAFFYPQRELMFTPEIADLEYEDIAIVSADGVRLHGWYLRAPGESRGTILHLHGNAGNVSTHLPNVFWMPEAGYSVLMLDYRGYGRSGGSASIEGALRDVDAALAWLAARPEVRTHGMAVLGQSLGGALAVHAVAHSPHRGLVRAVILDSAFSGYRRITREKLAQTWLTWPLQWPLAFTVPDRFSPERSVADLAPIPLLILHSDHDVVVPAAHAVALYEAAGEPKTYWRIRKADHIAGFSFAEVRERVIEWLDAAFAADPQASLTSRANGSSAKSVAALNQGPSADPVGSTSVPDSTSR